MELKVSKESVNSCAGLRTNELVPEESFSVYG